jgi:hypothetical protein
MFWDTIEERIKGFAYATEPQRLLLVAEDQAIFEGGHESHILLCVDGTWTCDCKAYAASCRLPGGDWCRHTVALERILAALAAGVHLPVRRAVVVH